GERIGDLRPPDYRMVRGRAAAQSGTPRLDLNASSSGRKTQADSDSARPACHTAFPSVDTARPFPRLDPQSPAARSGTSRHWWSLMLSAESDLSSRGYRPAA